MNPLISILIPVFQAEKTICRCLKSVLEQTNDNFEVVIIDDGSTDATPSICQSFACDKRFRIYSQCNMGVAATRQKLMELARGKYIQFVDADDWVEPNMVERYCEILHESAPDLVISDYILHLSGGSGYQSQEPSSLTSAALIKDISSQRMLGVLWNKLIRKELFLGLEFPNLRYCEDWCICLSLFQRAKRIEYNKFAFYHYDNTIVENSLTRNITPQTFKYRIEYLEYLKSIKFNELYPKEYASRVVGIGYTAIVYKIYSDKEFKNIFRGVSYWNNYNLAYRRALLIMTYFFSQSLIRNIDSLVRRLTGKVNIS